MSLGNDFFLIVLIRAYKGIGGTLEVSAGAHYNTLNIFVKHLNKMS